jgi:signal transduction histidine kinase
LTTLFETTKRSGVLVISPDIKIEDASVSSDLKLTIYRIVQEQLNNIIKYAKAKTVYIKVLQGKATIYLSIKDDGVGFDSSQRSKGVGLMNIRTRAALYNGRVTIVSEPGKGCELNVIFELPVVAVAV